MTKLNKIKNCWAAKEFEILTYRDCKDVFVLGDVEDITSTLEENQVCVASVGHGLAALAAVSRVLTFAGFSCRCFCNR